MTSNWPTLRIRIRAPSVPSTMHSTPKLFRQSIRPKLLSVTYCRSANRLATGGSSRSPPTGSSPGGDDNGNGDAGGAGVSVPVTVVFPLVVNGGASGDGGDFGDSCATED